MHLVERDREFAELSDALRECLHGGGGAAVISGGIGCGKTDLLAAFKHHAAAEGFLVLSAVGSWAERLSAGSVLGQLMRSPDAPLDARQCVTRLDAVAAEDDALDPACAFDQWTLDATTTGALHQLCLEVVRTAERVPVVLCVDDVQFTDSLSLYWMLQLLRRAGSEPILVVVAECTLSKPAHPQLHAELLRRPGYRRISLDRLSAEGVAAVLTGHLDTAAARSLTTDCLAVSGGNPLLVRALAEDYRYSAASPEGGAGQLVVGDSYRDAVLSCLHRGRPVLLRLAQALAVLDEDIHLTDMVSRLLEEESATFARGMFALEAAGLLDGGRLRHPAARLAVLESLTPRQYSALHRRAAELLYDSGAAAPRIAQHLIATDAAGLPWAMRVLHEAAQWYLASNRVADAHACLEAGLRVCDDDGARMRIKALLASTAWVLNPSIGARHLEELAAGLRDGRLPVHHALMLAKYLMWHGRFDEALDAVERIDDDGVATYPVDTSEVRATRELLSATYPAAVQPTARRNEPQRRAASHDDPRVLGAAALSYVLAHGPHGGAVADAEAAMRAMRLGKSTHEWITCAVAVLEFADRLDAAANWCDHWLDQARARRVPLWEAEFASLRARVALRQGEPARARRLSEAALAQVPAESWGVCIGGPLANLVQSATDTGDYEAAEEYLNVPVPEGMFHSRFGLYFLHARGRYHLETGRPYAALDDFTTCGKLMHAWGFDQPTLVPWRSEAARAHLAVSNAKAAQQLVQEQAALVGDAPSRARGITLRALAAAAHPRDRIDLLTEAVEVLRVCGDRLQLAGALAELGRAYQGAGRPARARQTTHMAVRLAGMCGAAPLVASLTEEGDSGAQGTGLPGAADAAVIVAPAPPTADLDLLSSAERRVAALAARGHTNREIEQQLSVTASTVEQHLTRVFRKLGVRTRQELPLQSALESGAE
jgi:DNA-binding CsgD family transcriptional regulator